MNSSFLNNTWNESIPKIIDNAIISYVGGK